MALHKALVLSIQMSLVVASLGVILSTIQHAQADEPKIEKLKLGPPIDAASQARFEQAIALGKSGENSKADAMLAELAPDDKSGYTPAHRMRAMILASQLRGNANPKVLNQLRWHLENSGNETTVEIEKLWVAYFVTSGQPKLAIPHMEDAAKLNPLLLISLANLYVQTGDKSAENQALRDAETFFEQRLKEDPLARDERLQLSLAQMRLNKPALAEETILKGVKLHNNDAMRRSAAEFYALQYDVTLKNRPNDFGLQFGFLEKATSQDPSFAGIYDRLMRAFQLSQATETRSGNANRDSTAHRQQIIDLLEAMIANGQAPPLARSALFGIYTLQGNSEKAKELKMQETK